jgi:peptidoglycan/LPS O-acetylase OafA/YrhL
MMTGICSGQTVHRPREKQSAQHFQLIDSLRGLASFQVMLHHIGTARIQPLAAQLPAWLNAAIFDQATLGVSVFFVLSGFIIAHALRNYKPSRAAFKNFLLRRFIRLSPPYYFSIAVVLAHNSAIALVKRQPFEWPSLGNLLSHLGYIQRLFHFPELSPVSIIYWTLCLEMQFYLAFVLLLGLGKRLERVLEVFLVAAGVSLLSPWFKVHDTGLPVTLLPVAQSFLLGIFVYWAWQRQMPPAYFYLYMALLLCLAILERDQFIVECCATAGLLYVAGRLNGLGHWLNQPIWKVLGAISYSLYLIHGPILNLVFFATKRMIIPTVGGTVLSLAIAIAACLGSAALMWYAIEKPAIAWSQRLRRS